MRFFTSDQHIGHENILRLGDGRPFRDLKHMHSIIMRNWYQVVQPDDEVWVLGDIAMGNLEQSIQFFAALPGRKLLVPGNHDRLFSGSNSRTRQEASRALYEAVGFEIQPETTHTRINGREVVLSHFPYAPTEHERSLKYAKNRPVDEGLPLIHGHTHARARFSANPREFHVGVDANDFTPVAESEISRWLEGI
jgi:calcineurin-like phosphoesterase family protein